MTRVLVTGGAGFIGSNFIHEILHDSGVPAAPCCGDRLAERARRGGVDAVLNVDALTYAADLRRLDGVAQSAFYAHERLDLADEVATEAAVRAFAPDVIVHFAAETHVDRSIESGTPFVRSNVLGTQNVLDAARRHDVAKVVHVSTDEVYGSRPRGSFDEKDPLAPSSPYAASKAAADLMVQSHQRTYGLAATITRCTNNYGPRQHEEKLIPKAIRCAMRGEPVPLYGDGANVRDWINVRDHCDAIRTVLDKAAFRGEVYNIAGRDERRNIDVVQTVLARVGRPPGLIRFVADRPGHDRRYSIDDSKVRALGWAPRVSFEAGLDAAIGWAKRRAPMPRPRTVARRPG